MNRETLARRIADVSLLRGEFTLRSGRKSNYYLDKYLFETQPDILKALGDLFAQKVGSHVDRIAGAELGAVALAGATAMSAGKPFVIIRNQKKDYGTSKLIEGKLVAGESMMIVEDVLTTGGQVLEAAKTLKDAGAKIDKIVAVIDRMEGARANIESAGYTFEALFTTKDLGVTQQQNVVMPKVRKAVITAAGRGTRQYPASTAVQKEMFPLVDRDGLTKPVVQIIAEEAIDAGIEQICIVTAPGEEKQYRDYFRRLDDQMVRSFRGKDWAILESEKLAAFGERLHFAEQATPEGFGHAVFQARDFVGDEPFLLLLGDHVYISDTKDRCALQLIRVFETYLLDAVTAVQPTLERHLHLFGVIRGSPIDAARGVYHADLIVEKPSIETARERLATPGLPAGNYLAHFGMHVFSPKIFDSLEYLIRNGLSERGEYQLTSAQEHLRSTTDKYWCLVTQGQRYDTGIPYGLMETQLALALNGIHRTEICEAIARILAMQVKA